MTISKKTRPIGFSFLVKNILLVLLCLICLFPLYWALVSSFKNESAIFGTELFPAKPTLNNYIYALSEMPILRMIGNSMVISIITAFFQVGVAVFFSYAMMRWDFKGKKWIMALLAISWLIPEQSIMIPNYVRINNMGLNGTIPGIVIPHLVSAFACMNLVNVFGAFPQTCIQAARLEGDGELGILFSIVLPNLKGGVASLMILQFISSWNDYLWPMLIARKLENAPVQIGLMSFVSSDVNMWGSLMAATILSCVPILLLYLVMQRNIVESFMKWGLK